MFRTRIYVCTVLIAVCIGLADVRAEMLDLTTVGAFDDIYGAWFYEAHAASTGSGVIDSFVRVAGHTDIEQGYNTSYRPVQFDENTTLRFTHDLLLSDIPIVTLNGIDYREFLLDINQNKSADGRMLSLDEIEIYLADAGSLHNYNIGAGTLTGATQIWELDDGANNYIKLDYSLNSGSGSGDMFAYIPDDLFRDLFPGEEYVYLYSRFGENFVNTADFEEWAVRTATTMKVVPVPGAVILGLLGLGIAGLKLRKYA